MTPSQVRTVVHTHACTHPSCRHTANSGSIKTAGRVSFKFSKASKPSGRRSTKTSFGHHYLADPVLAPEEVLFRRKYAPQRYAEKDIYFANQDLPEGGRGVLPDSDMLKAVHGFAGHFYEALEQRITGYGTRGSLNRVDERSMDETALLAFGILLEEAARESLGEDGDLVFTEGVGEADHEEQQGDKQRKKQETSTIPQGSSQVSVGFESDDAFSKRRYTKRRKVKYETD